MTERTISDSEVPPATAIDRLPRTALRRPRTVLTERNKAVLRAIQGGTARTGYTPTFAEIAEEVGLSSVGGVEHHVNRLTRLDYLTRVPNQRGGKLHVVKPLPMPKDPVATTPPVREVVSGDDLSEARLRVFLAIQEFMNENGHAPTYEEIAPLCGLKSGSGLSAYLDTLETSGYIERQRHRARRIVLLKRVEDPRNFPTAVIPEVTGEGVPAHLLEVQLIIQAFFAAEGRAPSLSEVSKRMSKPPCLNAIGEWITRLIGLGYLQRKDQPPRRPLVLLKRVVLPVHESGPA